MGTRRLVCPEVVALLVAIEDRVPDAPELNRSTGATELGERACSFTGIFFPEPSPVVYQEANTLGIGFSTITFRPRVPLLPFFA